MEPPSGLAEGPPKPQAEPKPQPPNVEAPTAVPTSVGEARGGRLLVGSHPEVVRLALTLYAQAQAEGIEVVFISGYRKFTPRKRGARGGWASWHNFGLAFDLNLTRRKGMSDAKAHWDEDRAQWDRLGALGRALGLVWGGDFRTPDIFHFEWHPGHDAWINPDDLRSFLALAGPDGKRYERVWSLFPADDAPAGGVRR